MMRAESSSDFIDVLQTIGVYFESYLALAVRLASRMLDCGLAR